MRAVFLGTPEFAVPSLVALAEAGHDIVAVYTQPDRPKGRGRELTESPVKRGAARLGLTNIRQPEKVRTEFDILRELRPDFMAVVGYGQLIPQSIIDIPRLGIINVHGSLLPRYRGAAPIQWAIASGEAVSGVTTMAIDAGLDTGPTILAAELAIGTTETSLDYGPRLAVVGAKLLVDTIDELARGRQPVAQDNSQATLAPILTRDDGKVDWTRPARVIYDRWRGFQPWPGAWTTFRDQKLSIIRCAPVEDTVSGEPGTLEARHRRLLAACGDGTTLELIEVQLEGRKRVAASEFLNGIRLADDVLGRPANTLKK